MVKYGAQLLTLTVEPHCTCPVPNRSPICRRSVAEKEMEKMSRKSEMQFGISTPLSPLTQNTTQASRHAVLLLKLRNLRHKLLSLGAATAQSVYRLATSWTVRGSNPGGGEILHTLPNRPCSQPSLLNNGYRVFPEGKRPGRGADHIPLSAPRSRTSRAIPLLPLWVFIGQN
jgi:hypothetical protein